MEEELRQLLADNAAKPDKDWALGLMEAHPTCVVPIALMLRRNSQVLTAEERQRAQATVMLGCRDRAAMADLADMAGSDWKDIYPPEALPEQKGTIDTIDTYLQIYGTHDEADDALLEKLIFNPVAPDYFQGTDVPFDPSDPLALPPELAQTQETQEPEPALPTTGGDGNDSKPREEPLLMESLAKIFIKQHRYERAFEIINNLSLKNPEKSAYFADQLRFLQKLIINQRFKEKKTIKN